MSAPDAAFLDAVRVLTDLDPGPEFQGVLVVGDRVIRLRGIRFDIENRTAELRNSRGIVARQTVGPSRLLLEKASRKVVESQEVMDHSIKIIMRGSTEHPKEMDALCTETAPEYAGLQLALKCAPEGGGDYALPFRDKACDGEETHAILIMAEQSY